MAQSVLQVTDKAAERIKLLMQKRQGNTVGIKIGVKTGGCSGLSYTFEYADTLNKFDEIIDDKDVKVIIDPKAVMFLIGTTLDYVEEVTKSGFVFINPNEKGKCGCGESFKV